MKTILKKSKCAYVLIMLLTLVSMSSCIFEGNDDDNAAEWSMVGTWYVSDVAGRNSPYRINDTFVFSSDRTFITYDYYSKEIIERGRWNIQDGQLIISFDGWSTTIVADMSNFPDDKVMLNVSDFDRGNYALYLVRDY